MNDPMAKALELSLAEAVLAVRMRPDDEACPDCYIAGSIEVFRRQHEAEREEFAALRAAISETLTDTAKLVALAQAHRQDSESVDAFEATKDAALDRATAADARLAALTAALEELEQNMRNSRIVEFDRGWWGQIVHGWIDRLAEAKK